ncbi:MAG TPA: MlaD family protein [Amycolatopsis sp.]|nr:MlaD family protein [Amycolatopsis sp.]
MPAAVHRDQARKFVIGVVTIVVIGVIGFVGARVQGGGSLPLKTYTNVSAAFGNVGLLQAEEDVTEGGVRIGQVTSIEYRDRQGIVHMRLDGDHQIYRDAHATIGNHSALGRKYVEIAPGTPAAGPLGDAEIPATQTTDSNSLDALFDVFDPQTRAGLDTSLQQLGGGMLGHSQDLHDVLSASPVLVTSLGDVTGTLASPDTDLPALLRSADTLTGRFQGHEQELSSLLEQTDTTLQALNVNGAKPLSDTIQALPSTLRQARAGLTSLNGPLADVQSAVTTIQPGGQALGASVPDLRAVLRDGTPVLNKVPGVAGQANPAVDDLTHTLADARPLVPKVSETLANADPLLAGLSPYASDAGRFFSEHDLLSGNYGPDKHFFSAMVAFPGLYNVSLPDPTSNSQVVPYPTPGGGAWAGQPNGGN